MDVNEKLLAIQLILEDIRGNWADSLEDRVITVKELATSLLSEKHLENDMSLMLDCINDFQGTIHSEWVDGRFFREEYPYGYYNMEKLHNLPKTYYDKSNEFKNAVKCITYPIYRFDDWK